MRLVNLTRGSVLAVEPGFAVTGRQRRRGLLGRDGLGPEAALVFEGCRQVHTFGMKFDIDVAFLDGSGTVIRCYRALSPGRITAFVRRARVVIEMTPGALERSSTACGDVVALLPDG